MKKSLNHRLVQLVFAIWLKPRSLMNQTTMATIDGLLAKADATTPLKQPNRLIPAFHYSFTGKRDEFLIYKSDDLKRDHLSQFSYPRSTGTTQLAQGIIESVNDSTVFFSSSYSHDEDDAPRLVYCCDDAIGITSPLPIVW